MQDSAVHIILSQITQYTTVSHHILAGRHYDIGTALLLLLAAFMACLIHFRFLKSHRVSTARLKARRRRRVCLGKTFSSEFFFPAWWDIAGHLVFKLAVPQVMYFLVTRNNPICVWFAVIGSLLVVCIILCREVEHIWSSTKVQRRRYFLHRLGSHFATGSITVGLVLHTAYVVVFLTFSTYGIHSIFPVSYQLSTPLTAESLFAMHLKMNFFGVVWHSLEGITPVTAVTIWLGFLPPLSFLILVGIGFTDLKRMPKPTRPKLRVELVELDTLVCDMTKYGEVEAAVTVIVEGLTGVSPVRAADDLFDTVGIDSLGFIELQFTLEEYFEVRRICDEEMMTARSIEELTKLMLRLVTEEGKAKFR